ncbi:MAG: TonB-dependent receptor [Acidobacteriota bacterium]
MRFAPNGAWLGTDPIGAKANDGSVLPAFHVRYAATPNTNLRFAVTRSLARPNYYDAVPYRTQDDNAATVMLGNADLRPTMSWNVDALAEHYFRSVGAVSAGAFYKNLADYVYLFTTQQNLGGVQYQVTQPLNGDVATIRGLEVALQNQLKFLPKPLQGLASTRTTRSLTRPRRFRATKVPTCRASRGMSATSPPRTNGADFRVVSPSISTAPTWTWWARPMRSIAITMSTVRWTSRSSRN